MIYLSTREILQNMDIFKENSHNFSYRTTEIASITSWCEKGGGGGGQKQPPEQPSPQHLTVTLKCNIFLPNFS